MKYGFRKLRARWDLVIWLLMAVMIAALVAAMLIGSGCTPVVMDAEYGEMLATETYRSAAIADLALNGKLDADQMRVEIMRVAAVLRHFKDAADGVRSDEYIHREPE